MALATWIKMRVREAAAAWLSLEPTENDPVRFWLYLLAAIEQIDRSLVVEARAGVASVANEPDAVIGPLCQALATADRLVMVIDDYHVIDNDDVHRSLGRLIDCLPSSTRLVVACRTAPPLDLAARRVRGELGDVGADQLRFSREETSRLLEGFRVALPETSLDRLLDRTEGWVAGIHLAALSLRAVEDKVGFVDRFSGANAHVFDYLAGEVLERQSEQRQEFLRRTSILERLSGELCDAVLDSTGSALVLEQLERANLFVVPLDSDRIWYRYHHLFADLLQRELRRMEPASEPALHSRAGAWHRAHGRAGSAIGHLTAAGQWAEAIELILASARPRFHSGQWMTVERWIGALPAEEVAREPRLSSSMAWAMFVGGRLGSTLEWIDRAEEGDVQLVTPGDGLTVAAEAALLRAMTLRSSGDFAGARAAAELAQELTAGSGVPRRFVANTALGMSQYWAGEVQAARHNLQTALPTLARHRDRLALAELLTRGHLAALELDAGQPAEAEELATEAARLAAERGSEDFHGYAMVPAVLGRLAAERGDLARAGEFLARARAALGPEGDVAVRAYIHVATGLAAAAEGDRSEAWAEFDAAQSWLRGRHTAGLEAMVSSARSVSRRPLVGVALTDREMQLLRLLPNDHSRRELASELYVSIETVKSHTRSLYRKLGVNSRAEAIERGREFGLLPD